MMTKGADVEAEKEKDLAAPNRAENSLTHFPRHLAESATCLVSSLVIMTCMAFFFLNSKSLVFFS